MSSPYIALIVLIVFMFVFSIVKMALRHEENMQRIKHGYPLKDGTRRTDAAEDDELAEIQKERLQ